MIKTYFLSKNLFSPRNCNWGLLACIKLGLRCSERLLPSVKKGYLGIRLCPSSAFAFKIEFLWYGYRITCISLLKMQLGVQWGNMSPPPPHPLWGPVTNTLQAFTVFVSKHGQTARLGVSNGTFLGFIKKQIFHFKDWVWKNQKFNSSLKFFITV